MVLVVDIISLFGDYFSMKCFVLRYTSNDMSYQSLLTVVSTFLQSSTYNIDPWKGERDVQATRTTNLSSKISVIRTMELCDESELYSHYLPATICIIPTYLRPMDHVIKQQRL